MQNQNSATYPVNVVNQIMDYEDGNMNQEQTISFFQSLVDSGLAWELQGTYGRHAMELIKAGLVHPPAHDYHWTKPHEPKVKVTMKLSEAIALSEDHHGKPSYEQWPLVFNAVSKLDKAIAKAK